MIEAQHLTKDYGSVVAVSDVSFSVGRGEIVGFLGPNGAGKTTTLRMLSGFLGPTDGTIVIDGVDMQRHPREAKRRLGYMPEAAPLYPEMRVREYLEFRAALKGVKRAARAEALRRVLAQTSIEDVAETIILHLSKGYRQRVGLADALIASPPLLILDEPTAGLDPNQIRDVRQLIRELGHSHTILLSTHILSEVEAICDRALVIDRGRLVAQGSLAELTTLGRSYSLVALVRDPEGRAEALAQTLRGVTRVSAEPAPDGLRRLQIDTDRSSEELPEELARVFARESIGLRSLNPGKASLEDVFAALTRDDGELTHASDERDQHGSARESRESGARS